MDIRRTLPGLDRSSPHPDDPDVHLWLWRSGWDGQRLICDVGMQSPYTSTVGQQLLNLWLELTFPFSIEATLQDGQAPLYADVSTGDLQTPNGDHPIGFSSEVIVDCQGHGLPTALTVRLSDTELWHIPIE